MGIKQIFQEGMKEFKRQSALRKEKHKLADKEKLLTEQLTALGKKAWESNLAIDAYGNSKELITNAQNRLDELNNQQGELETQKKELEDKKVEENRSFDAQRKEVEDKKREVDNRLNDEKKQLKEAQREKFNAEDRLKQIAREEERMNEKFSAPDTTEEQKTEITNKRQAFETEKPELNNKVEQASGVIKTCEEKIKPLEEESEKYHQEIEQVKDEQRKVIGDLDDSLGKINKDSADNKNTLAGVTKEQSENFKQLGEKIAGAGTGDEVVAAELNNVNTTKKEMEDLGVGIQSLEHQGTAASRGAMWKMIGLIAAAVVVVVGLVIGLSLLLGSGKDKKAQENPLVSVLSKNGDKATSMGEEVIKQATKKMLEKQAEADAEKYDKTNESEEPEKGDEEEKPPVTMEQAQKQINEMTGQLKEQSEKIQGKEIVVTDKETFLGVLPEISGWKTENTNYQKRQFGQLESSDLETTYVGPDNKQVEVRINDTGTASAALHPLKMIFSMNRQMETEEGYEKISTYNDIPVIEKFNKDPLHGSFLFIVKDRYIVELKAQGEGCIELLKQFIPKLDLSKLK